MINIKSKILLTFSLLLFYSCMEPNIEDLWSYEIESSFETNGFARDISINNDMSKYVLKDYNNNNNKTK